MPPRLSFGVLVKNVVTAEDWHAVASQVERLGYDTLAPSDPVNFHLLTVAPTPCD